MQLQARGFVEVQSRARLVRGRALGRGGARRLRGAAHRRGRHPGRSRPAAAAKVIRTLREHIADEQRAIDGADAATRAFLLADFHVCLAEQMGHRLLVRRAARPDRAHHAGRHALPVEARGRPVVRRARRHRRRAGSRRHARRRRAADARAHRQRRAGAARSSAPPLPDADERLRATLAPVALPRGIALTRVGPCNERGSATVDPTMNSPATPARRLPRPAGDRHGRLRLDPASPSSAP